MACIRVDINQLIPKYIKMQLQLFRFYIYSLRCPTNRLNSILKISIKLQQGNNQFHNSTLSYFLYFVPSVVQGRIVFQLPRAAFAWDESASSSPEEVITCYSSPKPPKKPEKYQNYEKHQKCQKHFGKIRCHTKTIKTMKK